MTASKTPSLTLEGRIMDTIQENTETHSKAIRVNTEICREISKINAKLVKFVEIFGTITFIYVVWTCYLVMITHVFLNK